ncbi:transporter [Rugosibacter aromaticivorans]|uniref:transporter n=1 Tax=Rugosibacter aromaticivorans TaxID=1565605 RepID=UPI0011FDA11C|nr:MAG: transporter [Rugosibacter sp.]
MVPGICALDRPFHFNFATEYEVLPGKLRLGVSGYFPRQTTDTEMNGPSIADTRARAFGIGPGMLWHVAMQRPRVRQLLPGVRR